MGIQIVQAKDMTFAESYGQDMANELQWPSPFNAELLKSFVEPQIPAEKTVMCVSSDSNGEAGGALCGLLSPSLFTGDLEAHEIFWYVRPEYRTGRSGLLLLKAFEQWAAAHEARYLFMSHFMNSPTLGNLYRRRGYVEFQHTYRKEL